MLRSTDQGRTWDQHDPVTAAPRAARDDWHPGPVDRGAARRAVDLQLLRLGPPPDAPYGAEVTGCYASVSRDGGKTWDTKHRTIDRVTTPGTYTATTDAIVELKNGDLLCPMYDSKLHHEGGGDRSVVFRSTDGGETWHEHGTMAYDPFGNLDFDERR
jgi:hypothetical protein